MNLLYGGIDYYKYNFLHIIFLTNIKKKKKKMNELKNNFSEKVLGFWNTLGRTEWVVPWKSHCFFLSDNITQGNVLSFCLN